MGDFPSIPSSHKHALPPSRVPLPPPLTPTHTFRKAPTSQPHQYVTPIRRKSTYDNITPSLTPKISEIYHIFAHNFAEVKDSSKQ